MSHFKINRRRFRIPKVVKRTFLSILILLILFVGGGIIYTFFAADEVQPKKQAAPTSSLKTNDIFKPHKPDPKNPVGVSVQSIETPVVRGSNTGINVKTTPDAKCTISVKYNEIESKDSGLVAKHADIYGLVSWTWTVPKNAPVGIWPVKVLCSYNKKSGMVIGNLQVKE